MQEIKREEFIAAIREKTDWVNSAKKSIALKIQSIEN